MCTCHSFLHGIQNYEKEKMIYWYSTIKIENHL